MEQASKHNAEPGFFTKKIASARAETASGTHFWSPGKPSTPPESAWGTPRNPARKRGGPQKPRHKPKWDSS